MRESFKIDSVNRNWAFVMESIFFEINNLNQRIEEKLAFLTKDLAGFEPRTYKQLNNNYLGKDHVYGNSRSFLITGSVQFFFLIECDKEILQKFRKYYKWLCIKYSSTDITFVQLLNLKLQPAFWFGYADIFYKSLLGRKGP